MKSVHRKVLNQVNEGIKYPCLMIGHDGRIVLFEKYQCGTV
ncbi:MAG: hypothetical protein RLY43_1487, partial [Bacteroidota bacterium]